MLSTQSPEVVLITGGARGLGLALATLYAKRGASLALCSRTRADLERAEQQLKTAFPDSKIETYVCDVSRKEEVFQMLSRIELSLGEIDILVNDAGVILASPTEEVGFADISESLESNLWGMVHTCLALAPRMEARRRGKILNIASIGGVIPVPHLLAYNTGKFGAVGFSTSLGISLRRSGVTVTTALPGLIRTGSFLKAKFKGKTVEEMEWFTLASTLPLISLPLESAAKRMIEACDAGKAFAPIGWSAKLGRLTYALAPNLILRVFGWVDRALPGAAAKEFGATEDSGKTGAEIQAKSGKHPQTRAGQSAAEKWNETQSPDPIASPLFENESDPRMGH